MRIPYFLGRYNANIPKNVWSSDDLHISSLFLCAVSVAFLDSKFYGTLYTTPFFSELHGFNGLVLWELSLLTTKLKAFMSAAQRQQFHVQQFLQKVSAEKVGMIRSAHDSDLEAGRADVIAPQKARPLTRRLGR